MNISQIVRLASYNADAIKKAGTLAPFVTTAELYAWANEGNRKLEKKLRFLGANYFERIMLSTTAATEKIMGINYVPSTSLKLSTSTNTATLPPDFQELRYIKPITSSYETTPMERMSHEKKEFRDALRDTTARSLGSAMLFDIIGERTFLFVPRLATALDVEIGYIARTKRLFEYEAGTITTTDASTAVVGVGTTWSTGAPFDSSYLDLMVSTTATVPVADPSLVYDGVTLNRVASIETDTTLTLAAAKVGATSEKAYALASIPTTPEDYHFMMADYVTMKILAKGGDAGAARAIMNWPDDVSDMMGTAGQRQSQDAETIEDWDPWED